MGAFNSGGSSLLAMDPRSQVKVTFTGTGITWIGYRDEWSGIANVYLDGTLKGTMDTYSPNPLPRTAVYAINGLSNASHSLTITVTGAHNSKSGGNWIWVDAFDVTSAPSTGTTTTTTTSTSTTAGLPASSSPVRVEQNSSAVSMTGGTWFTNTTAPSSGGSAVLSMDANARVTVTFTGTGVKWIGYRDEWSGSARVYVDGALAATIDTYATPAQAQSVLYTARGLSSGIHTMTIEVAGAHAAVSGASWVWVDAFDVTP
jgi:hypothetical protein